MKAEIEALMDGEPIGKLQSKEKDRRNAILRTIKASEGVSIHQIARLSGLNAMTIQRA